MGRDDVKRVRNKLRWFTFIVVMLAGVNSYVSGSIVESGGTNIAGFSGAFFTALFFFLAILIFISIPFNVLAFFVARINRYPFRAFQKINRVLAWLTVLFSLLLGIYCYFAGITAGSLNVAGVGGATYAIIIAMLLMIAVVVIPVNVIAFLVFAVRGPRASDTLSGDGVQWTAEERRIFQQERNDLALPDIRTSSEGQLRDQMRGFFRGVSSIGEVVSDVSLSHAFISLLARGGVSEEEVQELELWASKSKQTSDVADVVVAVAKYLADEPKRDKTVKDWVKEPIAKYVERELQESEKLRRQQEQQQTNS